MTTSIANKRTGCQTTASAIVKIQTWKETVVIEDDNACTNTQDNCRPNPEDSTACISKVHSSKIVVSWCPTETRCRINRSSKLHCRLHVIKERGSLLPKTTWRSSSQEVTTVVMKNCMNAHSEMARVSESNQKGGYQMVGMARQGSRLVYKTAWASGN